MYPLVSPHALILFADSSPCRGADLYNEPNEQHVKKYNLKEKRILVESHSSWSSPSSARRCKEAFHASKEKRNPLKNTKLTYFRSDVQTSSVYIKSVYNDNDAPESIASYEGEEPDTANQKSNYRSEWNLNSSPEKLTKADFCISSRLRAISDKYLKSSTNRLLAKLYRTSDKQTDAEKDDKREKESKRLRSFSYGTLPGLKEFQTFRDIEPKNAPDANPDSVSNIVVDENEDCDSGILVSSNSSVVDSCASSTYKHAGACHFRSASQDTPVPAEDKSVDESKYLRRDSRNLYLKFVAESEPSERTRLELTERQKRRQRLPLDAGLHSDASATPSPRVDIGGQFKVVRLRRLYVDDDIGIVIEKFVSGENDAFVIVNILPGGVAHR